MKALLAIGALVLVPDLALVTLIAAGTFNGHSELGLILSIIVLAWTAAISVVAIVDFVRRPSLDGDARLMWVLALILLGPLVLPVWWWKLVRPLPESAPHSGITAT